MNTLCFVYVITLTNGQFYIGSTDDLKKRLNRHYNELNAGKHHNTRFQEAWNEGARVSKVRTLDFAKREEAYEVEDKHIKEHLGNPNLLNILNGARGGDSLSYHPDSEDLIQERVKNFRNWMNSLTKDEKVSKFGKPGKLNPMFGKTHTAEIRELISKANKGHSRNKGIKLSAEHIRKIIERQRLRTGQKNSFYGKRHSSETIERIRKSKIGTKPSNMRKVSVDGVVYESMAAAARASNISIPLAQYRLAKPKYNWHYVD